MSDILAVVVVAGCGGNDSGVDEEHDAGGGGVG